MFPNPLTKMKIFFKNGDGMLPIEHGIAAVAVAAVIIASITCIGTDVSRVYSGAVLGSGTASRGADQVVGGPGAVGDGLNNEIQADPGLFAHLTRSTLDNRGND